MDDHNKDIGRNIVICPKCGENNSNTFRFCGMCGTLLEARRPANATAPNPPLAASKTVNAPEPQRPVVVQNAPHLAENSPRPASRPVPPISGPSMLGLNQAQPNPPVVNRPSLDRPNFDRPNFDGPNLDQRSLDPLTPNQPSPARPAVNQSGLSQQALNQRGFNPLPPNQRNMNAPAPLRPDMDSFRTSSFTGLDSFFEHEQPQKTGGFRILLLVVLLAALAVAGWWTYGYIDHADNRRSAGAGKSIGGAPRQPQSETTNATPSNSTGASPSASPNLAPNSSPATTPSAQDSSLSANAQSSQAPVSSTPVAEAPSQNANTSPDTSTTVTAPKAKPSAEAPPVTPSAAMRNKNAEKPKVHGTTVRPSRPPEPALADTGTADFQKGEAYLYGRGAPENCDQAVKYLKSASAKSSAKARSAFGTMYATGHCVARDLPTSYLWFAMALRVDPNNQILEKDLSAIWNQMTPPERQLATRMKQ